MRQRKDDDAESFWPWGSDDDEEEPETAEPAPRPTGPSHARVSALPPRRPPSESVLPSPRQRGAADRRTAGSSNRLRRGKTWGAPERRIAVELSEPGQPLAPASDASVGSATEPRPRASVPSVPSPRRERPRRTKVATTLGSRGQDLALLLLAVVVAALVVLALLG